MLSKPEKRSIRIQMSRRKITYLGLLGVKMFDTERYSSIMKKKIYGPRIKMIKQKLDVEGLDRLSGPWMLAVCLTDDWRLCSGLS